MSVVLATPAAVASVMSRGVPGILRSVVGRCVTFRRYASSLPAASRWVYSPWQRNGWYCPRNVFTAPRDAVLRDKDYPAERPPLRAALQRQTLRLSHGSAYKRPRALRKPNVPSPRSRKASTQRRSPRTRTARTRRSAQPRGRGTQRAQTRRTQGWRPHPRRHSQPFALDKKRYLQHGASKNGSASKAGKSLKHRMNQVVPAVRRKVRRYSPLSRRTNKVIKKRTRRAVQRARSSLSSMVSKARRLERRYISKGDLTKPFDSDTELYRWYKKMVEEQLQRKRQKKWGLRTQRALKQWTRLFEAANKKKKRRRPLSSIRRYLAKHMDALGLTTLSGVDATALRGYFQQLQEASAKRKLEDKARSLWTKLGSKLTPEELQLQDKPESLVEWYSSRKEKQDLEQARRAATRSFNKGQLNFCPDLASDALILSWYRTQRETRKQKRKLP